MEPGSTQQFIVLGILLCLYAFFSMSETALTSLGMMRLRNMLDQKIKGAERVDKLLSNQNKLLSSILVANNIVSIAAAALATALAIQLSGNGGLAVGVATFTMTFLLLVFGEIVPKTLAAYNSEKISLLVAGPIRFVVWLLTPVVYLIGIITGALIKLSGANPIKAPPLITESELKTMVNVGHEEGFLEIDERQMIHNVFEFGQNNARDVMIQRTDMVAVDAEDRYNEIRTKFEDEGFSRMPVYRDSIDDIIGILYLKDFAFFKGTDNEFKLEGFMREPFFTYESKPIDQLFNLMRAKRVSIAVVLDEYGGTAGMITLEDLIEEIVGEIEDEYDVEEEEICKIKENEYLVDGSTKIDELNDSIGTQLESEDFESIGGYVIGILGYIPLQGETVTHENMTFTIEEVDKNRISKLRIFTAGPEEAASID